VTWIDDTGYVVSPLDGVNGVRRNLRHLSGMQGGGYRSIEPTSNPGIKAEFRCARGSSPACKSSKRTEKRLFLPITPHFRQL
jgi:hypothetical protein